MKIFNRLRHAIKKQSQLETIEAEEFYGPDLILPYSYKHYTKKQLKDLNETIKNHKSEWNTEALVAHLKNNRTRFTEKEIQEAIKRGKEAAKKGKANARKQTQKDGGQGFLRIYKKKR